MPRTLAALACCAVLALAACSPGASTVATSPSPVAPTEGAIAAASEGPTVSPSATPTAGPTTPPSASPTATPTASPTPRSTPRSTPKSTPGPTPRSTPRATPSHASARCKPTTSAGSVLVKIIDFGFTPKAIKAKVGQVIRFTNTGFELHNAKLTTVDCKTPTLATGKSGGLVFATPGSYAFHCSIHSWMTGTITIRR